MNQPSKAICVQITGRDSTGADFNEMAWIDQCGNFGTIIYTPIHLNLGDRLYIRNTSAEVVATAEVVWRRVGETPAVEVLLKRGYELADPPPMPTEASKPAPQLTQDRPQVAEKKKEEPKAQVEVPKQQNNESKKQQPVKPKPTPGIQERKPPSASVVETEKQKPIAPAQLEQQATLEQFRKIGIAATIVFAIFLGILLSPLGKPEPTRFNLIKQSSCTEANSLGRQSANQQGELEFWSEGQNGQITFFLREGVTPPQAIEEMAKQSSLSNKVAGIWCAKGESRVVEDADSALLPVELSASWNLLPVGKNAAQASKIVLYLDSTRLVFLEDGVDRTAEVVNATYYEGSQKLVIRLNGMAATGTKAAVRELKLYLPRTGTGAVAESQLADSTWQSYIASSNPRTASTDMRFIATAAVAPLLLLSAGYVVFNLIQSRK